MLIRVEEPEFKSSLHGEWGVCRLNETEILFPNIQSIQFDCVLHLCQVNLVFLGLVNFVIG
jgi:hypothetical protein